MPQIRSLVSVSVPGSLGPSEWLIPLRDHPVISWVISLLDRNKITYQQCDTIQTWGNCDQDWIEFTCDVETSWSWCKPSFLNDEEWNIFFVLLNRGDLLMQVRTGA